VAEYWIKVAPPRDRKGGKNRGDEGGMERSEDLRVTH
jgi:hypothetical protein